MLWIAYPILLALMLWKLDDSKFKEQQKPLFVSLLNLSFSLAVILTMGWHNLLVLWWLCGVTSLYIRFKKQ